MATAQLDIPAGPFYIGEVPEPIDITVTENDDTAFDLTGATVAGSWNVNDGTDSSLTVTVTNAAAGQVRVSWASTQFDESGTIRATVWATFGSGVKVVLGRIYATISDPGADIS